MRTVEAVYYKTLKDNKVRCLLCPHACLMEPGEAGICRARVNRSGKLFAESYGRLSALHLDPVEKKPLYHFFPKNMILSVGSYGCNLSCPWCQNASISKCAPDPGAGFHSPGQVVKKAVSYGGLGLAYTYNEPAVWFEYMFDMSTLIRQEGKKNVVVTNGYINSEPLEQLMDVCDAFNVDLKSFSDDFYRQYAGGSLSPVLRSIKAIAGRGIHLEISFLVVTGLNDDTGNFKEMVHWIASEAGRGCVLHINRYFPSWKATYPPTPLATMHRMKTIAEEHLDRVYLGNVH